MTDPIASVPRPTERLILRRFEPANAADMHAYRGLPDVARYLYQAPLTLADCERKIATVAPATRWQEDGDSLLFAVGRPEDTRILGEVVITLTSAAARQTEIGWIFHPEFHGRGYALEAARALRDYGFTTLGAHRIFARLDADNAASARLCERLGMRREAHLIENDLTPEGAWGSEYIYALLASEPRP
ncbi:GNAT family N-acetyltransferase [Mycetocola spongiae]|uniref:GNAT family N-acetyltransferase n=1 Tax=Mycetocola spongiae TaxID=2859226 RepID=UPI001CF41D0C|nr:GNAT family N-acetyltransferase [Mycetocola spongiae]UCR88823.1 GNAT family N-acetyltransferase [Mycetocola spongiae]